MPEVQLREAHREEERVGSRALLGAAVATALLYLMAVVAIGEPPAAADSGQQVLAWFHDHGGAARWSTWALTLSIPAFAAMFALLRGLLPAPHRDVFLIGGITMIAVTSVQTWTWAGLALHADRLEPMTARTVLDVALFWGPVLTGATLTFMAPVTLLALQGAAGLPRWIGILGAVACVEQAIETVTIFGRSGFTEPGGAMNLQLGALLVAVWLIAFAVWGGLRGRFRAARA
ncbi:MAG TPA: hypothetical protein VFD92_06575 [Candidatus Binatia bacterium]|nr:hypothetical protein [Candidatus Binatia bacterium]